MHHWEKTWLENDLRRCIKLEDERRRFEAQQLEAELKACRELGIVHSSELGTRRCP